MILTVTLNPALDLTYRVERFEPHAVNRVGEVTARGGGKGVNVSRVLAQLGAETRATGVAGGPTGRQILDDLAAGGLDADFVEIAGESRRTVVIVEAGGGRPSTGLWEPGPELAPAEWSAFTDRYAELLERTRLVVLSGRPPAGAPGDGYPRLIGAARRRGLPVILDMSGPAFATALAAGPTLIKPNTAELGELTGIEVADRDSALAAARAARALGVESVAASLGPDGIVGVSDAGAFHARLGRALEGNDTGAGDAAVAALAEALVAGRPWPEALRRAVALSAAAVLAPVAGAVDLDAFAALLDDVEVEALPAR